MRPRRPHPSLHVGARVDGGPAPSPSVRSDGELTPRTRAWTLLGTALGCFLVHVADLVLLSTTTAPGDRTVVAATALPWLVAGLWAARALLRGTGVGPVGGSVALTAGCVGIAVDGALTGTAGQEVMCALGLMALAIGLVVGGTSSTVRWSGPTLVLLQFGMLLVAHRGEPASWFLALSAASVTAGIIAVVAWLQEERRATLDALATAAVHDPLTGLLNRRGMGEGFPRVRGAAGSGQRACAIVVDLDHFKAVNDALGHGAGDQALVAVAGVLRDQARAGDLVVRLGGEEMAWIGCWDDEGSAAAAAERLRRTVSDAAMPFGLHLTLSGGVAFSTDVTQGLPDAEALSRLLVRADEALYRAKDEGRDRIAVAAPLISPGAEPAPPGRGGAPAPRARGEGSSSGAVGAGGTQRA